MIAQASAVADGLLAGSPSAGYRHAPGLGSFQAAVCVNVLSSLASSSSKQRPLPELPPKIRQRLPLRSSCI